MLQGVIGQVVDDDPALKLVGESATVEGLPGLWERAEADVVVVRSLSADVSAAVLPAGADAHIPQVLGVDHRGTRRAGRAADAHGYAGSARQGTSLKLVIGSAR
jgi:hypothetical protein